MKKYYLIKAFEKAIALDKELINTGSTEQDYDNGKAVEISKKQFYFYKNNPTASFKEIIDMKMMGGE